MDKNINVKNTRNYFWETLQNSIQVNKLSLIRITLLGGGSYTVLGHLRLLLGRRLLIVLLLGNGSGILRLLEHGLRVNQ